VNRHCTWTRGERRRRYQAMQRRPKRRGPARCPARARASRFGVKRPNLKAAKAIAWNGPGSVVPPQAAAQALQGPPGLQAAARGAPQPAEQPG
jgi:hypothetical protein